LGRPLPPRIASVSFETLGSSPRAVEPPDQLADQVDGQPLAFIERDQLVHQPLGMDPAEGMGAYSKLTGIVGDDGDLVEQTVMMDAAEERALGRDPRPGDWRSAGADAERAARSPALPGCARAFRRMQRH
jgi:hypothetical protein